MIQASLRISRDRLAAAGVCYPKATDVVDVDEATITSGNGGAVLRSPDAFERALRLYAAGDQPKYLFSNEMMFQEWVKWDTISDISRVAAKYGFGKVEVLLFIRNPISHAASLWQQGVKRSGRTITIEDSFAGYRIPGMVAKLIQGVEADDNITLTIRNYSVVKRDLLGEMAGWLGIDADTLVRPKVETINRSMTHGELSLQMAFNRVFGPSGHFVSDPLCEKLPSIKAEPILPNADVQKALWDSMRGPRRVVNRFSGPTHAYEFDEGPASPMTGVAELTDEQLFIVAEAVAQKKRVKKRRRKASKPAVEVSLMGRVKRLFRL